jgi:hypothetical protein
MRKTLFAAASLLLAGWASAAVADDAQATPRVDGEKPAAKPGSVVLEETWSYPLRFESLTALDNARYHYRRNEEKSAAGEVRRAVSWLKFAAGHAMPISKEKLETAATELTTLANDLDAGKISDGAQMGKALARASFALAEWHFYKAKESFGKNEAGYAAKDLEAAAGHLRYAANSAHYQYGPDTLTVFKNVLKNGKMVSEEKTIDNDLLSEDLDGIEKAVKEMGNALKPNSTNVAVTTAKTMTKAETGKPAASPGSVVVDDDWWYPLRFDFLDSLDRARAHYRAREEQAAGEEIDKAVAWLKYAEDRADKVTAEELSTARSDLMDFSADLKSGRPIVAKKLDASFAHAAAALAKHHHYLASKALAEGDLQTAQRHLLAAADHVRAAARSANYEYGKDFVSIYDDFAPHGYWDETIRFTASSLGSNLTIIQNELDKLAAKLK